MTTSNPDSEERLSQARAVFQEYLRRREQGAADFESYLFSQPELRAELESLHAEWLKSAPASDSAGSRSLHAERLQKLERQRVPTQSRYEVRGELGRGGMAFVFEAWDTDLRRSIAMKVLRREDPAARPNASGADASVVRFLEEAQITAQLDHPGIVPVHELGVDAAGHVYFTMGRVKGRTLKEVLDEFHAGGGTWTRTRLVGLFVKVCETMAFAHAKGVVHRDLKPSNVMVGRFGAVYVMDWGLSIAKDHEAFAHDLRLRQDPAISLSQMRTDRRDFEESNLDAPLITMEGAVLGTPAYMSPEQARGEIEEIGPRSDVYSAGAMLYQTLTGRMPYIERGMRVSPHTVLALVISGPPAPIAKLAPDVPPELVAICEKAMAREPEDRYPSMDAFAEDLHAYLENRVVRAYEAGAWAELKKWTARNRRFAAASAAALLCALAGLAVWGAMQRTLAEERALAADVYRLRYLLAEADELWPATAATAPRMQRWLEQIAELEARRDEQVERLAKLRGANLSDAAFAEASRTGRWRFEDAGAQATHDALAAMVAELPKLASDDPEVSRAADVRARLAFALSVEERSVAQHAAEWDAAIASIRDPEECPMYGGLELRPQVGLVPIGRDPASGLWEFAHLFTGDPPEREFDGTLALEEDSGLVFVLIPGGSFTMGARPPVPATASGPNLDPRAHSYEGPPHTVELDPYFLSKYEMTQAQWRRVTHAVPSLYHPGAEFDDRLDKEQPWLHPVEYVSWEDCDRTLTKLGLCLPTEAQWERAARAGSGAAYSVDFEDLERVANLADETARDAGAQWPEIDIDEWSGVYDGWAVHSPVNAKEPNAFGLHDVHGNVFEWCRDWFVQYNDDEGLPPVGTVRAGDGYREALEEKFRSNCKIARGGSCRYGPLKARVSARYYQLPRYVEFFIGVRPARALER